jgi:hypothetical protein
VGGLGRCYLLFVTVASFYNNNISSRRSTLRAAQALLGAHKKAPRIRRFCTPHTELPEAWWSEAWRKARSHMSKV